MARRRRYGAMRRKRRVGRRRYRGRGGVRRRVARGRMGRAKQGMVVGTYRCENAYCGYVAAGVNSLTAEAYVDEGLPMYATSGANTTALVWQFQPVLTQLTRAVTGDLCYSTWAALYDQLKVLRVTYVLTPPMGLSNSLTTPLATSTQAPLLQGLMQRMPDISFVNFDGDQTLPTVTPADGDYTPSCYNRWSARSHAFGRPIRISIRPRMMTSVYTNQYNQVVTPTVPVQYKNSWLSGNVSLPYLGQAWLAVSYKGLAGTSTQQPEITYSLQTFWKICHRMPIYG